jgi:hypothetical protein
MLHVKDKKVGDMETQKPPLSLRLCCCCKTGICIPFAASRFGTAAKIALIVGCQWEKLAPQVKKKVILAIHILL